jgi:hypothetical protein
MSNETSLPKIFAQKQETMPELTSELNTFAKEMINLVDNLTDQNRAKDLMQIWNTLIRAHNLLTHRYLNDEILKQAVHNVLQYDNGEGGTQNLFTQKIELTYQGKTYVFLHDYTGEKQVVTINTLSRDQLAAGQPSSPNSKPAGPDGDGGGDTPPPPVQ